MLVVYVVLGDTSIISLISLKIIPKSFYKKFSFDAANKSIVVGGITKYFDRINIFEAFE